jgi:outer membrane lipoprotein SlyB
MTAVGGAERSDFALVAGAVAWQITGSSIREMSFETSQ